MIADNRGENESFPSSRPRRLVIRKPGESVQLQELGISDATALFNLVDADRNHFVPFGSAFPDEVYSVNDAMTNIARPHLGRIRFGIWDDGQIRGETDLMYRATGLAEVGYWIGGEHTRKRYATRSQQLLASWAFEAGRVNLLYANIDVNNVASRGVVESAGFVQVELSPEEQLDDTDENIVQYVRSKNTSSSE